MKNENLIGRCFGKLTVLRESGRVRYPGGGSTPLFDCQCACGKTATVLRGSLLSGRTQSCGCSNGRHRELSLNTPVKLTDGCIGIPLNAGYCAIIDAADLELVSRFVWSAYVRLRRDGTVLTVYAMHKCTPDAEGKRRTIKIHRLIMGVTDPKIEIDHEDGDGLNNRRRNLRVANRVQNMQNARKTQLPKSSRFKGVSWDRQLNKWDAHIRINGKQQTLGKFADEIEAAKAYDGAATHFGKFARINFPTKGSAF
jgi:hypothetical protein